MSTIAEDLRQLAETAEAHAPESSGGLVARIQRDLIRALLDHFGPDDEKPDPDPDAKAPASSSTTKGK